MSDKFLSKVVNFEIPGENGGVTSVLWKNFCTNPTKFFYGMNPAAREILYLSNWIQEEHHAGKGRDLRREYRQAESS